MTDSKPARGLGEQITRASINANDPAGGDISEIAAPPLSEEQLRIQAERQAALENDLIAGTLSQEAKEKRAKKING